MRKKWLMISNVLKENEVIKCMLSNCQSGDDYPEVSKIREGKQIIDVSLRKRGLSSGDVEERSCKKERYNYKNIRYVH